MRESTKLAKPSEPKCGEGSVSRPPTPASGPEGMGGAPKAPQGVAYRHRASKFRH